MGQARKGDIRVRNFKGRKSLRDQKISVNKSLDFYAAMSSNPSPDAPRNVIVPKRERATRNKALETALVGMIQRAARAIPGVKLYRNNRGVAQFGNHTVAFGVGPRGGSDFIGYRTVKITPDMVGSEIAQFCALEAKAPGKLLDPDQRKFIDSVRAAGGHAAMIDSIHDLQFFVREGK